MKKYILVIIIAISLFSCRTKEVVRIQYVKDSVELNSLKSKLSEKENEIISLISKNNLTEQKFNDVVEKLQISESEKQVLKETYETIIREYNEEGKLIKETFSKRITDFVKEINTFKEENKQLKDELYHTQEMNIVLQKEKERAMNKLIESDKAVKYLEQRLEDIKKQQQTKSNWWVWMLIGVAVGLVIYHYLGGIFRRLFDKIKRQV